MKTLKPSISIRQKLSTEPFCVLQDLRTVNKDEKIQHNFFYQEVNIWNSNSNEIKIF